MNKVEKVEKVEEDRAISLLIDFLYYVGIWTHSPESNLRKFCKEIVMMIESLTLVILISAGMYQAYKDGETVQYFSLMEFQISLVTTVMKLAYGILSKERLLKFFLDPNVTHHKANSEQAKLVNIENRKFYVFNKFYFANLLATITLLNLVALPIFSGHKNSLHFFINIEFNFKYGQIVYWIVYVQVGFACVVDAMFAFSMVIVWYILYNYSIEYKVLGQRLRCLGTGTTSTYQKDITQLVKDHQNLYELV